MKKKFKFKFYTCSILGYWFEIYQIYLSSNFDNHNNIFFIFINTFYDIISFSSIRES